MRQLNPLTNLLLAVLAAAGVGMSLALPWYAAHPPEPEEASTIEGMAGDLMRVFTEPGVTGTDSLGSGRTVLLALVAATALLCVAHLASGLRRTARPLLRTVPLAAPVVVVVQAIDGPADSELRWGLLVALAAAGFMASCAFHGAELRDRKPKPASYRPPAPPAGSFGPNA